MSIRDIPPGRLAVQAEIEAARRKRADELARQGLTMDEAGSAFEAVRAGLEAPSAPMAAEPRDATETRDRAEHLAEALADLELRAKGAGAAFEVVRAELEDLREQSRIPGSVIQDAALVMAAQADGVDVADQAVRLARFVLTVAQDRGTRS